MRPTFRHNRCRNHVVTTLCIICIIISYIYLKQFWLHLYNNAHRRGLSLLSGNWTPVVICVQDPEWATGWSWPQCAAQIYATSANPVNLLFFSGSSPFHDSVTLLDPRSSEDRKQLETILVAALRGIVSHVVWVYPSWLPGATKNFYMADQYTIGLVAITGNSTRAVPSESDNVFTTLCLCPAVGNCSLPLLYNPTFSITPDACTRNSTIVFERILDVIAESLPEEINQSCQQQERQSSIESPWVPQSCGDQPINFVFLHSDYFGTDSTSLVNRPTSRSAVAQEFLNKIRRIYNKNLRSTQHRPPLSFNEFTGFVDSGFTLRSSHNALLEFPNSSLGSGEDFSVTCLLPSGNSARTLTDRTSECSRLKPLYVAILHSILPASSPLTVDIVDLWLWICRLSDQDSQTLASWIPQLQSKTNSISLVSRPSVTLSSPPNPAEAILMFHRLDAILAQIPVFHLSSSPSNSPKSPMSQQICDFISHV